MRARAWALSLMSSAAVLLMGWQLGSQAQGAVLPETSTAATAAPRDASSPSPTPAKSATSTPTSTPTASAAPTVSGTFVGDAASTPFGSVQVEITVADGTITDVTALSLTDRDPHSVSISNRAAPMLRSQVLQAQSAHVDGVSGATYTTDGYLTSVQSAIDKSGL